MSLEYKDGKKKCFSCNQYKEPELFWHDKHTQDGQGNNKTY